VPYRKLISTDQFKDLIEIEKQFGHIELGRSDDEKLNQKPSGKITNPHWFKLAEFLTYNRKQMNHFKD